MRRDRAVTGVLFSGLLATVSVGSGAAASAPTPVQVAAAATEAKAGSSSPPRAASSCYTERDVTFVSTAKGITIAGTLSTPVGGGVHPAVLMITGNGPHTREQRISNSPMFTMIGDHLARRGFVVLRTDARGFGGSTGPNNDELYTTADRVEDNRAALEFLRQQPGVDGGRIVLLGHSEGAMIAAELAPEARPALTVLLSTSALPGREVFARQRADNLRRRGGTEEASDAVYQQLLRFADFLASPDRTNRAQFDAIALDFLEAHGVQKKDLDPKLAQSLLDGFLEAPWYWYFVTLDPRVALRRIHTPVFAVFGEEDENLRWRDHLVSLVESVGADRGAGADTTAELTTAVLPDQGHFFLEFEGRRMVKHVAGKMVIAEELYAVLDAELTRRGLAGKTCR